MVMNSMAYSGAIMSKIVILFSERRLFMKYDPEGRYHCCDGDCSKCEYGKTEYHNTYKVSFCDSEKINIQKVIPPKGIRL